jgi:arginine decarboxylase
VLDVEASHDLDRLQVLLDVSATGTSGYQARDWLRRCRYLDAGLVDHRRILATLSIADDRCTADRLLDALTAWRDAADSLDRPPAMRLPRPDELQLATVMLPRDAFFGPAELVAAQKAAVRIAAEQITPYPPGIPVVIPGERINDAVIEFLRTGLQAGMSLPDCADPQLRRIRVVA